MEAPSVAKRLLVGVLALAILLLSGTMAWALAEDLNDTRTVPDGVRLVPLVRAPVDVSGMTSDQLSACITTSVIDPLLQPVNVRYGKRTFVLNVRGRGLVRVNVAAMLDSAFSARNGSTLASRVMQGLNGTTQTVDVRPKYSVDLTRTRVWVGSVAKSIDRRPVNATRRVAGNRVYIRRSIPGLVVNRTMTLDRIRRSILSGKTLPKVVTLPVTVVKPKIHESSFGKTIVVDKSERRLYLYDGAKLKNSYRVAVGMPGYPTPLGQFEIVQKRYMPTWTNPGSAWAADMPAYIPPGPGNPLGTRALNLSASGIRIHGTNKIGSIGTAASHGCIRMLRANVEELYNLVKVGTAVYVVP